MTISSGSLCSITCGRCGQTADMDEFTKTPIGGDLPKGQYQCPFCNVAWKIEKDGEATILESGFVMPPKLKVVETDSQM